MKKIRCKKLGNVISISLNSEYEVVNESETRYSLINDKGVQKNYCKSLFDEVVDEVVVPQRAPRQPRRVEPVPVPVRVIPQVEELNIVTNIHESSDNDNLNFQIDVTFLPGFVYSKRINELNIEGTNISCGVSKIYGIDYFKNSIRILNNELQGYIQNNRENFILSEDFNLDEVMSDIIKALVQDMISYFQDEDADVKAGILILSTTSDSINELPMLKEALDEVSTVVETRNPNSGNIITMWTIVVNE
jgi:hypothetical protein